MKKKTKTRRISCGWMVIFKEDNRWVPITWAYDDTQDAAICAYNKFRDNRDHESYEKVHADGIMECVEIFAEVPV